MSNGGDLRRALPLLLLFVVGLAAGIWVFVTPWAVGFPVSHGWTSAVWASVWVGGIVAAGSGLSLVCVLARSLHLALHERTTTR